MCRSSVMCGKPAFFPVMLLLASGSLVFAQGKEIDYNTYYQFPLSLGVEYQSISPFAPYGSTFGISDLSVNVRWPIPPYPFLQPLLRIGMMGFDSQDQVEPLEWDHTDIYGAAGLSYTHRFAKNLELGAEALAGYSLALFANLLPETGTVSSSNLLLELGGRISLDPTFNLSIDVHPNLKYLTSLGPLKDFDGFIFGIGFSASYRFGQDPDAPAATIRSIRFEELVFPPAFAAMQSFYTKNPIGSVVLVNTDREAISDLQVAFIQAGYMDSPTPVATIPELKGGESRKVPLLASFNAQVFTTEGVTPLTGEIIVAYTARGRASEQRQPVSYDLHDKTAVTWDDDRKVAAFITPADSALRNYSSFIRQACREDTLPGYSEPLQLGIQVYHALGEIGCLYQADPAQPFTKVQGNSTVVDSISLPRDTLKRSTGDCDDLTVLFCSLLETAGAETAFITVPGHIYAAVNTRAAARDYRAVHPDRGMTINFNGELWVPVEITLIGKTGFAEAWRKGVEEWVAYDKTPEKRGFYPTRQSQELYRPVGLKEMDLGLQYGRKEQILKDFRADMDRIVASATQAYADEAKKSGRKEDFNKLGITYAQFLNYPQAEAAFKQALKLDSGYVNARINLANILYLKKDYSTALLRFQEVLQDLERQGQPKSDKVLNVLLNISRTCYQMERFADAKTYLGRAEKIDGAKAAEYAYLGERTSEQGRAAQGGDTAREILFAAEE